MVLMLNLFTGFSLKELERENAVVLRVLLM